MSKFVMRPNIDDGQYTLVVVEKNNDTIICCCRRRRRHSLWIWRAKGDNGCILFPQNVHAIRIFVYKMELLGFNTSVLWIDGDTTAVRI